MPGVYVQSATHAEQASGTTIAATFPGSTTTGNLIYLSVAYSGNTAPSGIADSPGGNTYTLIRTTYNATYGMSHSTYYAKNITGGATPTVTVTWGASHDWEVLNVSEYSGLDTTAPLDQETGQYQTGVGTGADAVTSGAMTTTTVANCTLIASTQMPNSGGDSVSAGTSYTLRAAAEPFFKTEDRNVSATGAYAGTFTTSANTHELHTHVAAFKEGSAASPTISSNLRGALSRTYRPRPYAPGRGR
jgi:hypothetical protein